MLVGLGLVFPPKLFSEIDAILFLRCSAENCLYFLGVSRDVSSSVDVPQQAPLVYIQNFSLQV